MSRRGSHLRCRRCGAARHRNVREPYCGRCWKEFRLPQIEAEKAAIRARKREALGDTTTADVVAAIIQASPDPIAAVLADDLREHVFDQPLEEFAITIELADELMAAQKEGTPSMVGRSSLSPAARAEIVEAYRTGMNTSEICEAWHIGLGLLYRLVRNAGVPLRSQNNGVLVIDPAPEAPESPQDEPVAEEVPEEVREPRVPASVYGYRWSVTYEVRRTETVEVVASSFTTAAAAVTVDLPEAEITRIERVD